MKDACRAEWTRLRSLASPPTTAVRQAAQPACFVRHRAERERIAYRSGWGDGSYPTWIGRDDAGNVVCFVSDMLVLGPGAVVSAQRDPS
jgi:Protein of unknown function (DUF4241)